MAVQYADRIPSRGRPRTLVSLQVRVLSWASAEGQNGSVRAEMHPAAFSCVLLVTPLAPSTPLRFQYLLVLALSSLHLRQPKLEISA